MKQNKTLVFIFLFFLSLKVLGQQVDSNEMTIRQVLAQQADAWSKGNLEEYMKGYWKSDSLLFIGKRGLTYGWQSTLDNYKKSYPDKTAMGKLTFDIKKVEPIEEGKSYFVVGKWHLARKIGDLEGHFSLLWRKINGEWVIVADHSS